MSNLRRDYLGRPVLYAPSRRVQTPVALTVHEQNEERGNCPFCPDNEPACPEERFRVTLGGIWHARVVPNKFPVVTSDAAYPGIHEVVIENRNHNPSSHGPAHLTMALQAVQNRIRDLSQLPYVKQVLWLKNCGFAAGASILHPHSHLQAMPFVHPESLPLMRERKCIICGEINRSKKNDLAITATEQFISFCPWASRFPFEVWIAPLHEAVGRIEDLTDDTTWQLTSLISDALTRIQLCYEELVGKADLAYNMILHTPPVGHQKPFHWYLAIKPRIKPLAALEMSGVYVNAIYPEQAAGELRATLDP